MEDKADLEVTKICKPDDFLAAGKTGHCTIFVDNHGPSYARSVTLTDVMLSDGSFTVEQHRRRARARVVRSAPVTGGQKFVCNLGTLANASPSTDGPGDGRLTSSTRTEAMDINDLATVTAATPDPDTSQQLGAGVRRGDRRDRPRDRQDRTGQRHRGHATRRTPSRSPTTVRRRRRGSRSRTTSRPAPRCISVTASNGATCNAGVPGNALRPTRVLVREPGAGARPGTHDGGDPGAAGHSRTAQQRRAGDQPDVRRRPVEQPGHQRCDGGRVGRPVDHQDRLAGPGGRGVAADLHDHRHQRGSVDR